MAEKIIIEKLTKKEQYEELIPQIKAVVGGESDLVANLANVSAMLKEVFGFFWVGFYLVKNGELVLGPFQGVLACTRIKKGKGVCGVAWLKSETVLVDDVENFDGHIACSSESKSEIVVPILFNGIVVAVLDVDSDRLANFDSDDQKGLQKIAEIISLLF